jgi:hypothetical protein
MLLRTLSRFRQLPGRTAAEQAFLSLAAMTSPFSRWTGAVSGLPRVTGFMALDVPSSPSLLIRSGKLTLAFHVARDRRHRIMERQEAGARHPGQPGTGGCIDDEQRRGDFGDCSERPSQPVAQRPGARLELRRDHNHIHGNLPARGGTIVLVLGREIGCQARYGRAPRRVIACKPPALLMTSDHGRLGLLRGSSPVPCAVYAAHASWPPGSTRISGAIGDSSVRTAAMRPDCRQH